MNRNPEAIVYVDYTNWRGERKIRKIQPISLEFTSNQFHPEPQWLIQALDIDSTKVKWFSMKNIHNWTPG